jgi:hypothetical protein
MDKKKLLLPVLVGVLIIVLGAAGYLYMEVTKLKEDPQAAARKEAEALVAIVGKIIILPADELPTIATVSDPTKLADQAFFAKAKVGDKVLLYATARKAYLYDPTANKILEVAPINLGESDTTVAPIPTEPEEPSGEEAADDGLDAGAEAP